MALSVVTRKTFSERYTKASQGEIFDVILEISKNKIAALQFLPPRTSARVAPSVAEGLLSCHLHPLCVNLFSSFQIHLFKTTNRQGSADGQV